MESSSIRCCVVSVVFATLDQATRGGEALRRLCEQQCLKIFRAFCSSDRMVCRTNLPAYPRSMPRPRFPFTRQVLALQVAVVTLVVGVGFVLFGWMVDRELINQYGQRSLGVAHS